MGLLGPVLTLMTEEIAPTRPQPARCLQWPALDCSSGAPWRMMPNQFKVEPMSSVEKAYETQLRNIEKKTGKSLEELAR
jgi:hypothetical protein